MKSFLSPYVSFFTSAPSQFLVPCKSHLSRLRSTYCAPYSFIILDTLILWCLHNGSAKLSSHWWLIVYGKQNLLKGNIFMKWRIHLVKEIKGSTALFFFFFFPSRIMPYYSSERINVVHQRLKGVPIGKIKKN